jgi:hypothetical protein
LFPLEVDEKSFLCRLDNLAAAATPPGELPVAALLPVLSLVSVQ